MAKYICQVTEVYRCDTESEAKQLIESSKHQKYYELKKYNCEFKERKSKGEVIDAWYRVTLTKAINSEKEPEMMIDVIYEDVDNYKPITEDEDNED